MTVADLGIAVQMQGVQQATSGLSGLTSASKQAEKAAETLAAKTEVATKAFRLNRIGMMEMQAAGINSFQALAAGMDPFRVAIMESSQVVGAFVQGTEGGFRAIGALVSRFPLATAAIVAAGAAFAAYELIGHQTTEQLDKAIKEHSQTISDLRKAYGIAGDAAEDYGRRSTAALESAERRARAILRDSVAAADKIAKGALSDSGGFSGVGLLQRLGLLGGDDLGAVKLQFAAFAEPIEKLRQQIKEGKPDYAAFQQELQRIANTDPGRLQPIADKILGIIDAAAEGHDKLSSVSVALDQISQNQIDTARIVAQINNIETAAKNAQGAGDALLQMLGHLDQLASGVAPKEDSIGGKGAMDRAQSQFDNSANLALRMNPDLLGGLYKKPKNTRADHSAERAASAYQQVLKSAQNRIDQMKVELQLTGQVGVAADTLRNYQELLSRATDHGRTIGEKQQKELHDRAEEMAKLEQATREAKLAQDLLFERDQLGRSDIDQQIAAMQRGAGLPVDLKSSTAEIFRMNAAISTTQDAWRNFGDAAEDALTRLAAGTGNWRDLLASMIPIVKDLILQLLKAQSIGAGGSGDFSLGGLLASAFGGGGGLSSTALAAVAGGAGGLYAKGGAFQNGISGYSNSIVSSPTLFRFAHGTGLMGEAGPEGILPLRRNSAGQLGVIAANDRAANQNSRTQIDVVVSVNDDGTLGVIARQAGGQAADVRIQQYDRGMPARVKQINDDPRAR